MAVVTKREAEMAIAADKRRRLLAPPRTWRTLPYRLARRGPGLRLAQVWVCDLDTLGERSWDDRYVFRRLDADDIRRLAADPMSDLAGDMALRLAEAGTHCFAALDGPTLACYAWCTERIVGPDDTLGFALAIPADSFYLFKALSFPPYRGRGVYTLAARRTLTELRQPGKRRALCLIEYGNPSSVGSHRRIGFRPQGWLASLGRAQRAWRYYPATARQLGFGAWQAVDEHRCEP